MVIAHKFLATCRACGKRGILLFEYMGLPGGRYGYHNCREAAKFFAKHPRLSLMKNVRRAAK